MVPLKFRRKISTLATVAWGLMIAIGLASEAFAQAPAALTAQEKANIQVIDEFIAAFRAWDRAKVMSFFADDARFAFGEIGKTPAYTKPNFPGLLSTAKSVSVVITPGTKWARGPVVTHERVDKIVLENGREIAGKYIAVFTLRDGKIVDWTDYEFERPAPRP